MKKLIVLVAVAVMTLLSTIGANAQATNGTLKVYIVTSNDSYVSTTLTDDSKNVEIETSSHTEVTLEMGVYTFVVTSNVNNYDNVAVTCSDINDESQQDADIDEDTFIVPVYSNKTVTCYVYMREVHMYYMPVIMK